MGNKTFSKNLSMLNVIGLRESINDLMSKESSYVPVASICKAYVKKLDSGQHEECIYESFINELSRVADHTSTRTLISNINKTVNEHKRDIEIVKALYEMQNSAYSYVVPMVESVVVDYLSDKNAENRSAARGKLSLFNGIDGINTILENLSFDEYEEKTGAKLVNLSLNEALIPNEGPVTYTQEQLDEQIENAKKAALEEAAAASKGKSLSSIDSHINLDLSIKNILKRETKNESLRAFCEQYSAALNSGKPEELLYESFISGLSNWNYLNAVDTEMNAIKSRVSQYKQEIDLKKIMETMLQTGSYYIVPLIEDCVVDYVDNKTMSNKAVLKQRLQAFEYDPFVRDILNVVMHDQALEANVYLGESIETSRNGVHTEKIFSPVLYVKENECIFNVKGIYYNKKGNTITKLAKRSVDNLDESFKMLCNLVNHPAVQIDDLSDTISVFEGHDSAKISESSVIVNGVSTTAKELGDMADMSHLMNEHKEGFFKAVNMLSENFNNIAYLDFVKRVSMNESSKTVDVFRIKDKLFVTTIDESMGDITFYRNVSPLQCRTCINEHMDIKVSNLFEDILPDQKAILEGIEDTRKEYEDTLAKLKERKEKIEALKDDGAEGADLDAALKLVDDDIAEIEKDYKKYQEDTDKFLNAESDDTADADDASTGDSSTGEAPADASTGDDASTGAASETPDQMSVPIEQGDSNAPAEDPDVAAALAAANSEDAAIKSATPFDPDFDVFGENEIAQSDDSVQVLRVSYDTNVKNGVKTNKGTAFVVIPSVNANGDVRDETKSITFYLDPSRKPILNNEDMPLSIYNAIVNAIASNPDTADISVEPDAGEAIANAAADEPVADASVDEPVAAAVIDIPADGPAVEAPALDIPSADANPDEPASDADVNNAFDAAASADSAAAEPAASIDNTASVDDFMDTIPGLDDNGEGAEGNEDGEGTIPSATEETPAETANTNAVEYPIEIGMDINDIKPIKSGDFQDAMSDFGIETSKVEGVENGICIKLSDKSQVHAFRNYFKEWKNFSQAEFCNFFPELKNCFDGKASVPVMAESIQIKSIEGINESILLKDNPKGGVKITLPYTEDYANMFGYPQNGTHPVAIEVITENVKETEDVYNKLHSYSIAKEGHIDEAAKNFLGRYAQDFENVISESKYNLTVPYNGFLAQKLATKGITFSEDSMNETMTVVVEKGDVQKARKVFEGFYGDKTPVAVKDFFQYSDELLSEGLKITVRDDKSGKSVEIDTDELLSDGDNSADTDDDAHFEDSFENTTFNPEESALTASESDDNSSEDEEKKEDTDKDGEDKKEDKPKKRFMFKKKVHESVKTEPKNDVDVSQHLNESAESKAKPNVYDWVIVPGDRKGQIICTMPTTGNFIVYVDGRTMEFEPKSVKLATNKQDTLDPPMKFDADTLKLLFEQMVPCGMFMNGNRLTPGDCYVKYSDFINAKDEDNIRLVIEGQNTMASKKYVKVTCDINEFANIADYCAGKYDKEKTNESVDVLINVRDWNKATSDLSPVRSIFEGTLSYLPYGSLNIIEK